MLNSTIYTRFINISSTFCFTVFIEAYKETFLPSLMLEKSKCTRKSAVARNSLANLTACSFLRNTNSI